MLWTAKETADFLRISKRTVYEMARTGCLPVVRVGRQVRFSGDVVKEWARAGGARLDAGTHKLPTQA